MKYLRNQFTYIFRKSSFFLKALFLFTIFSLVMISLAVFWVMHHSTVVTVQSNLDAQYNYTRQTMGAVDLTLQHIGENMSSTFLNQSVIPLVIAPVGQSYEKKVLLTRQLNNALTANRGIKNIFLYVPKGNMVYTPSGAIMPLSQYNDYSVINHYLQDHDDNLMGFNSRFKTGVFFENDRLFLIQNFPASENKCVGVLAFELDKFELFDELLQKKLNSELQLFAPDLDGFVRIWGEEDTIPANLKEITAGSSGYFSDYKTKQTKFYWRSQKSGWMLIYSVPTDTLYPSFKLIVNTLIPFLALLVVFSLLFSFLLSVILYRPVGTLVRTMEETPLYNGTLPSTKNEFELLKSAYNMAISQTSLYTGILQDIAPSILERLVESCIRGEIKSNDEIARKLQSLSGVFKENDRYLVCCIETPKLDNNTYLRMVTEAKTFLAPICAYIPLHFKENNLILFVMRHPAETPAMQCASQAGEFMQYLQNKLPDEPFIFGIGQVYNHITSLVYSYRDALEALRYVRTLSQSQESASPDLSAEFDLGEANDKHNHFLRRIAHIEEDIDLQDYHHAQEFCVRVIFEIAQELLELDEVKQLYGILVERLINKLLTFKASRNDPLLTAISPISTELGFCLDKDEAAQFMVQYCNELILLFESYQNKIKHKYIIRSKGYIEKHIANRDLSLQMVAESIGIHPAYLSKVFKENLGVNFIDYLNQYRVAQAAQLLVNEPDLPIGDVGEKAGFQSMSSFFRVFRKFENVTPGQYREQNRKR